ncbi:hypothetical protein HYH70_15810 [Clostridium botulinum]|uniref:hypothetical protein n=1 Tax=Clostridium botulinum TaxID=1491 RepID=UPI00040AC3EE|nr:hypothetical protein [Clostridium botulinum]MBY6907048.1 hypothetical protein [Clostridium botulinum]MBY6928562.1 hypothetical protein [Clostridium botulinum]MBY6956157.1 hypothetical protein [Clostridium botulinum]
MGKVLIINREYVILEGALDGTVGRLIIYDAMKNEATLKLDELTKVVTNSENLKLLNND